MARIIVRILTRHPTLSGLWHVASKPISKFDLLKLCQIKLSWEGVIKPNDEFVCDRSLNGDRFNEATGGSSVPRSTRVPPRRSNPIA